MSSKGEIICRKCGGNHLTIKCGKNSQVINNETTENNNNDEFKQVPYKNTKFSNNNIITTNNTPDNTRYPNNETRTNIIRTPNNSTRINNTKSSNNEEFKQVSYSKYNDNSGKYNDNSGKYQKFNTKVKLCGLPRDITKDELFDLLYDWGNIKYINVNEYYDDTVAFIDFRDEAQASYFIKAIDNTPFEYKILKAYNID